MSLFLHFELIWRLLLCLEYIHNYFFSFLALINSISPIEKGEVLYMCMFAYCISEDYMLCIFT
jgi:hypothetical protein